jgi:hypothetical protein
MSNLSNLAIFIYEIEFVGVFARYDVPSGIWTILTLYAFYASWSLLSKYIKSGFSGGII